MYTTDIAPGRIGLSTSTGRRGVPRAAGNKPLPAKNQVSYEGAGSYEERIKEILRKEKEKDEYDRITNENKSRVGAGESPAKDVGGSVAVLDASTDRLRKISAEMGRDTNALLSQKGMSDNDVAANAKARGLGQYNGNQGGVMQAVEYGQGRYNSLFEQGRALEAAADDAAAAAKLEAQRNNNRISAKTAADAAAAADNAYSQRYAAAQAADAQKFASTMQMFGGLASPGAYKYWGG